MVLESPTGGSAGRMGGAPPLPPDTPSLSAFQASPDSEGKPGAGQAGALPRLFFAATQALDAIASSAPSLASDIDDVKGILMDALRKVSAGGTKDEAAKSPIPGEGLPSYSAS